MRIKQKQFQSSSSTLVYTAVIDLDTGATSCNCKGWSFKKPGQERWCKHTKEMLATYYTKKEASPKLTYEFIKKPKWNEWEEAERQKSIKAFSKAQEHLTAEVAKAPKRRMIVFEEET